MSSLAIEDLQDQLHSHTTTLAYAPELQVVKSRLTQHQASPSFTTNLDEVVYIGGRFTVSF